MEHEQILDKAFVWAKLKHPHSNRYRYAAFANSVAYLVTGASGGYGGPSCREHAVSWAKAGNNGYNLPTPTTIGQLTVQFPDGRRKAAGEWEFERDCLFALALCFGELGELHHHCQKESGLYRFIISWGLSKAHHLSTFLGASLLNQARFAPR